jgi:hypothetical protein
VAEYYNRQAQHEKQVLMIEARNNARAGAFLFGGMRIFVVVLAGSFFALHRP